MVGWRNDPVYQKTAAGIQEAIRNGDKAKIDEIDRRLEALAQPVAFREWVDKGLAVHIAPHDYSNRELTLAIAQQMGSSHEDDAVEEPIVRLQRVVLAGETGDIAPLIGFARYVVRVGLDFLHYVVLRHRYEPRYFTYDVSTVNED
jgi:hypothetical protein